jgi:hypothetical protein
MRRTLAGSLAAVLLLGFGVLTAFALLEGLTRVFLPISPGTRILALDDEPVDIHCGSAVRLCSAVAFHEVASEFDARITLSNAGNRVPDSSRPALVFVGDSFTFGTGLHDEQTFAFRYCAATGRACVNLGRSGTGTGEQIDVLEHYLVTEGWEPDEVWLFMVAMTDALMAGNDLADNLKCATGPGEPQNGDGVLHILASSRREVLNRSNGARAIYFHLAPLLRTLLSPAPREKTLDAALDATRMQLLRLHALGRRYGFRYRIFVLHPVQDLLRQTHTRTLEAVAGIAPPGIPVTETAAVLLDDPTRYYYSYNGHLNPAGARAITRLLLRESGRLASLAP